MKSYCDPHDAACLRLRAPQHPARRPPHPLTASETHAACSAAARAAIRFLVMHLHLQCARWQLLPAHTRLSPAKLIAPHSDSKTGQQNSGPTTCMALPAARLVNHVRSAGSRRAHANTHYNTVTMARRLTPHTHAAYRLQAHAAVLKHSMVPSRQTRTHSVYEILL